MQWPQAVDEDPTGVLTFWHAVCSLLVLGYPGTLASQFDYVNIVVRPLDDDTYQVSMLRKEGLPEFTALTAPKVLSERSVASFVRQTALLADQMAVLHVRADALEFSRAAMFGLTFTWPFPARGSILPVSAGPHGQLYQPPAPDPSHQRAQHAKQHDEPTDASSKRWRRRWRRRCDWCRQRRCIRRRGGHKADGSGRRPRDDARPHCRLYHVQLDRAGVHNIVQLHAILYTRCLRPRNDLVTECRRAEVHPVVPHNGRQHRHRPNVASAVACENSDGDRSGVAQC